MRAIPSLKVLLIAGTLSLTSCASNLASVRTFATGMSTVTHDTATIVASDQESCTEDSNLQKEFSAITHTHIPLQMPCDSLALTLKKILAENTVLEAYASTLNDLAQNQFATTTDDAGAISGTLASANVGPTAAEAAASVFNVVETAALDGWRQRKIKDAMSESVSSALTVVLENYAALISQYESEINDESGDITIILRAIKHDSSAKEPVAVAEFEVRLNSVQSSLQQRKGALQSFANAAAKILPAYKEARNDLAHPSRHEILEDTKNFAIQVREAHTKLVAAFH